MSKIELNQWFVNGNDLSIALMNFFVRINIKDETGKVIVSITNNNNDSLFISFDTLENGISFVKNTVANCFDIEEINEIYKSYRLKLKNNL